MIFRMTMRAAALMLAASGQLTFGSCERIVAQTSTPRPSGAAGGAATTFRPGADAASISGTIEGPDGTPLARARVVLRSTSLKRPRGVVTDAQGAYGFRGLPAGEYAIHVTKTGFALPHASGGPRGGVLLRLAEHETRTRLRIALRPAGTIPGRLLDEDGTPLAGADIEARSLRTESADGVASARSDDRGEFRLTGLAEGQYFVVARDPALEGTGEQSGPVRFAPTYFPGVLSSSEAQPVTVTEGRDSTRVEFRLRLARPARIAGAMVAPEGRRLRNGAVLLIPRDGMLPLPLAAEDVDLRPDGHFDFRNVPPGTYQVRARAQVAADAPMLFGTFAVTVEERDIDGLSIVLAPGAVVQGRVEWQPASARPAHTERYLRVRAPLADGSSLGDSHPGEAARDGSFSIPGLMAGSHFVVVEGLPEPWAVTRVVVRGRDLQGQPMSVAPGDRLHGVRVVVSAATGDLAGIVRNQAGRPAADTLVVTMPQSLRAATRADPRFRVTRTDATGHYRFRALSPGTYRVAAVAGLEEIVARRPEWIDTLARLGVPVSVGPEPRTEDLTEMRAPALSAFPIR
jgi:protocatechuate 3,4-dioxygenase beta subunit